MVTTTTSTVCYSSAVPTANVTVNRNRLKLYGSKVYLKGGSNFEIELFNPKTVSVLAKIFVNGQSISNSGIVVKPGQRVYLERWIDDKRKFLFDTYEVENTNEAQQAIAKNGLVKVEFYDEYTPPVVYPNNWGNPIWVVQPDYWTVQPHYNQPYIYCGGNGTFNLSNGTTSNGVVGGTTTLANSGCSTFTSSVNCSSYNAGEVTMDSLNVGDDAGGILRQSSVETGRAEKGEHSSQNLVSVNMDFNSWYTTMTEIQIVPESQKPVEVSKIRTYCTQCRTRIKASNWKFCPSCGAAVND